MRGLIIIVIISALGLSFLNILSTEAQTEPQFLVTWRAGAYVSPDFGGKAMPSKGSEISASLEIIVAGKIADLSKQIIYWYLDNNFIKGGQGVKDIFFTASKPAGGNHNLRIQLPDFKGNLLIKTVDIPIVRPEVVIEAPFPNKKISGSKINLLGRPFFFNAQNQSLFDFNWTVNGLPPDTLDNPQTLEINLENSESGGVLNISLNIQNRGRTLESAFKTISLMLTK